MLFENLRVTNVIIHEVYRRMDDRRPVPPRYGQQLLSLDLDAMAFFRERVIAAVGSKSQCMEMSFSFPIETGSALEIARDLLGSTGNHFIDNSRRYADRLTAVQTARNLPGGIVVVFSGTAGNPARQVVGVIKAETHSGFRHTQSMQVQYLKDLFMGPQTKLYKIGVFAYDETTPSMALPNGWKVFVYDSQMTSANRDGAAQYFYESFLGCSLPVNSAQLTKKFYESTREFINKLDVSDERKSDLVSGLYAYLKVDQTPTVEVAVFSNQFLEPSLQDDYAAFMQRKEFPTVAVSKDISDIQSRLRQRRLVFSRSIQLIAPPDAFEELVKVRTIDGEPVPGGTQQKWTQITIRDHVRDQQ